LLLGADAANALDRERRAATLFGDFAVLLDDEPTRDLVVVLEAAEQRRRHAAVRALRTVLVNDVEEGELAFRVGPGFLWHARSYRTKPPRRQSRSREFHITSALASGGDAADAGCGDATGPFVPGRRAPSGPAHCRTIQTACRCWAQDGSSRPVRGAEPVLMPG